MTEARFKIVFDGELLPDMSLDTVKDNLARLFKSDRSRIEHLFEHRAVVLKRDLSADQVDKYLVALNRAGANVRKEPDMAASLSLITTEEEQLAAAPKAPEYMICPKCAQEQAKAIECTACGIVIDKYLARQAQLIAENGQADSATPSPAAGAPMAAELPSQSPYSPPRAPVGDVLPEFAELNVFGVEGRIGRLRYLAWSLVLMLAAGGLIGIAAIGLNIHPIVGGVLFLGIFIGMMVVAVQIGVQRLHDIGWSGWLFLLNLIPVVGSVMALLMLVVPGTNGPNRFGPPPPPNSRAVKILSAVWLLVVIAGVVVGASGGFATLSELGNQVSEGLPATPAAPSNPYGE
ncbi:DUF805 domain-containing protein [Pseudomonas sp. LS44]|uniref:DUF805 domain-containing protein n=1 Tax=Pseudomonas sp. LS44 TaxID=1357074 RepID=UPI00215B3A94|nr:DUF805 domain-containing protein [Pseudomonas sp. LS44]UVE17368.1 DUF805 domain-containing protein [Pseudomonas sp. LS44]